MGIGASNWLAALTGAVSGVKDWSDQNTVRQDKRNALAQQIMQQGREDNFRQQGLDIQRQGQESLVNDRVNDNLQHGFDKLPGGELQDSPLAQFGLRTGQAQKVTPHDTLPIASDPLQVLRDTGVLPKSAPGTSPAPPTGVDFARPTQVIKPFSDAEVKGQKAAADAVQNGKHIAAAQQHFAAGRMDEGFAELAKATDPAQIASVGNAGLSLTKPPTPQQPTQLSAEDKILVDDYIRRNPKATQAEALIATKRAMHDASVTPPPVVPANEKPAWTRAHSEAMADLAKSRQPLATRNDAIDRGLSLIGTDNAMAMSTLIPEFISATAGGMGTGLRITGGEIKNSEQARSWAEGVKQTMQQAQTGKQLTPAQTQQMTEALTALKAYVGQKLSAHDEAEAQINGSQSAEEIRQHLQEFHSRMSQGKAPGAGGGSSSGTTVIIVTPDGREIPVAQADVLRAVAMGGKVKGAGGGR